MGNAVSHASEETLYVCAVAVMIEGGDNCEEGKLAVPLSMWREVEYHILVCGLVVRCLVMESRHGILVDWHVLVNDLREVYNFCVCHSGLFVVSKNQAMSRSWSGMFWDVLIDVCARILWKWGVEPV